jgi:hypothetical protein
MTEREWTDTTDPFKMLWFLKGKDNPRKMRLFVIACCRRVWAKLTDERSRQAIEVAERYVEGEANETEREMARQNAKRAMLESDREAGGDFAWALRGELVALSVADRVSASLLTYLFNEDVQKRNPTGEPAETTAQADLLRDLFGPLPFRRISFNRRWLSQSVKDVAHAIYREQAFGQLGVLSDALEDAGCTNEDLLLHCREPGLHVRGCWVVDLLLGKA